MTKNFKLEEFACPCCKENKIQDIVIYKIQTVRDFLKDPILITSGYRCPEHNKAVGGSETSSHLKGLAIDIFVPNAFYAFKILKAINDTGAFTRIGYGKKNDKLVLHVDSDKEKSNFVFWGY